MKKIFSIKKISTRNPFVMQSLYLLGAVLITGFFSLNIPNYPKRFSIFSSAGNDGFLLYTLACAGIYVGLKKVRGICFRKAQWGQTLIQIILSVFFAGFSVLGVFFASEEGVASLGIFTSLLSLFPFLLGFVGGTLFFFIVFRLIWNLPNLFQRLNFYQSPRLSSFFGKHLYRNCILLVAIVWLPQFICRFPGILYYDTWRLLAMYFKCPDLSAGASIEMTNIHPLIWTIPVGKLTELGFHIGIPWIGFAIISLIQHLAALFLIGYVIASLKEFKFPTIFLAGVLAFYLLLPQMSLYASTIQNDFLYSLSAMLLTTELMHYLFSREKYFKSIRHIGLTMLGVFGFILRYNGLYTMLLCFSVIALREVWLLLKRKANILHPFLLFLSVAIALSSGQWIQNHLNEAYQVTSLTSRVKFALPIQQIARCIAVRGEQIPQDIRDDIHVVMEWSDEEIAENYDPLNFDGVKLCFKTDATKEELGTFVKGWLRLVKAYPVDCILATAHQNYYLFSPISQNFRCYTSSRATLPKIEERYDMDTDAFLPKTHIFDFLSSALSNFCNAEIASAPFWGILGNQAAYTILLFGIVFATLRRKDKRVVFLTLIPLTTLMITFLGPAVFLHPRYSYPIMFSMPILLSAFLLGDGFHSFRKEEGILSE